MAPSPSSPNQAHGLTAFTSALPTSAAAPVFFARSARSCGSSRSPSTGAAQRRRRLAALLGMGKHSKEARLHHITEGKGDLLELL
ncbi:hypothetical protein [Nannocystis pusilla]|uniref:hypothetical protein n=1 Tax=Nannocystis pusilla TaxID=889268 RepID=UPI003B7F6A3C